MRMEKVKRLFLAEYISFIMGLLCFYHWSFSFPMGSLQFWGDQGPFIVTEIWRSGIRKKEVNNGIIEEKTYPITTLPWATSSLFICSLLIKKKLQNLESGTLVSPKYLNYPE